MFRGRCQNWVGVAETGCPGFLINVLAHGLPPHKFADSGKLTLRSSSSKGQLLQQQTARSAYWLKH